MTKTKLTQLLCYLTAVVIVLVPFQALLTTWLGSNFGYIDVFRIWKELILMVLAAGCLYLIYTDKKLKTWFKGSRLVLLIALYVFLQVSLAFIAFANHKVNGPAVIYGLMVNLRFLIFFLVCLVLAMESKWLTVHWRKLILWPAVIVVSFAVLQLTVLPDNFLKHFGYGPNTIPAYHTIDRKSDYVRLQSTLRGPNPLGAYLLVIMTMLVAWLTRKKSFSVTILCIVTGLVLFFTYSRSAWLGLALSLAVLAFFWAQKANKVKQVGLIFVASILILAGMVFVFRDNDRLQNSLFHTDETSKSAKSSNSVRTQSILSGAESIIKEPLGRGVGTAGPASTRNNHPARIADNYFVQIGQETGIIGLALFVAINILVAVKLWLIRDQELAKIALAALIGLTLVNFISHAWADDTLAYIYWGLVGLALVSYQPALERSSKRR